MNRQKYLSKIIELLGESDRFFIDIPAEMITENTKISEDLSMDSIQIIELLVGIEEEWNIQFDFEDLDADDIYSVGTVIDMLEKSLNQV